jgi:CRISPR-associated endonuclease/helicase Cas3
MNELLAKPTGVPLKKHVQNLLQQATSAFAGRPFVIRKYNDMTGDNFVVAVKQSARWHDAGKADDEWQTPCQRDYAEYQLLEEKQKRYFRAKNIQKANVRHELASLEYALKLNTSLSLPVQAAVAAHHGKLSHRHKHRWEYRATFKKFWDDFLNESDSLRISDPESLEQAILKRYRFAGPRAWLQMIDHRASAFEQDEELPPLQTFDYQFPHATKRGVQLEIEKLWDEPFAILRAPTGAGKTDAALLWAQHQVEQGRADRLVIAMPTRFTANALSIAVTQENFKSLGDAGLYHSSAWYQRIKDKLHPTTKEKRFIDKEQELAQKLETPFTVTTIDHLCICLTGTREAHHAVFFGLAHSCVVIDEVDFYDGFTQASIIVLLRVLRILKVPVLLMSATVPESAIGSYAQSGFEIQKIHVDNSDIKRPRCHIKRYETKAEQPEDIDELLRRALRQPTIIYANTVARAQAYYRWFKLAFEASGISLDDLVLYHSRFIEPHKVEKEDRLREMLGREAWKHGQQRGLAILTQIGEVSVNISADLMISDLCPLDRLTQRVGRLSRFAERGIEVNNKVGELFVIKPFRTNKNGEQKFYPAPYGEYRQNVGWLPSEALLLSDILLRDRFYSAKDFIDLVNELYPQAATEESYVRVNRQELEKLIVNNWLILPQETNEEKTTEDADRTKDWKCRDIPFQHTIFAGFDPSGLDDSFYPPTNKSELREFEIRYGITCHAYEYKNAVENGLIDSCTFYIGYEQVTRPYVLSPYYNNRFGLSFFGIDDD